MLNVSCNYYCFDVDLDPDTDFKKSKGLLFVKNKFTGFLKVLSTLIFKLLCNRDRCWLKVVDIVYAQQHLSVHSLNRAG